MVVGPAQIGRGASTRCCAREACNQCAFAAAADAALMPDNGPPAGQRDKVAYKALSLASYFTPKPPPPTGPGF